MLLFLVIWQQLIPQLNVSVDEQQCQLVDVVKEVLLQLDLDISIQESVILVVHSFNIVFKFSHQFFKFAAVLLSPFQVVRSLLWLYRLGLYRAILLLRRQVILTATARRCALILQRKIIFVVTIHNKFSLSQTLKQVYRSFWCMDHFLDLICNFSQVFILVF